MDIQPKHFSRRAAEAAEVPVDTEMRMVLLGRFFSRFSQVQSARLAPKDKGFSLRALRLCVSNCNAWADAT